MDGKDVKREEDEEDEGGVLHHIFVLSFNIPTGSNISHFICALLYKY